MVSRNNHTERFFDINTGLSTKDDECDTREHDNGYFPVFDSRGKYLGRYAYNEFIPLRDD